jgi:pSer/pThr/pTyr-binding forkhead associated (FHA) protein
VPAAPGPIKEVRLVWADQIYTVDSVGSKDIGRAQDAPLRVNHPTVSRRHARLVVEASAAFVEDLGGTNGTMLNGKVITGRKELQDGDMIGVGDVQLKVAIQRG